MRIRTHPVRYIEQIYGEHEMGGTSWMYHSVASFKELGMREDLGVTPAPELTAAALGSVPMVIALWPVFLTGIYAMTKRNEKIAQLEKEKAVKTALEDSAKTKIKEGS